jgi:Fe-S-cluster containining protein
MKDEYKKLLEIARSKKKENKTFFEALKKIPSGKLDQTFHELHEEAFEKIDCLQCANCCRTTGPLLREKDIQRLSDHLKKRPAVFTSENLRIDEDNDYVFTKMPCPFLKEDNHCSVYSARPNACREYPHTDQREVRSILPLTYENTMICPAVSYIVEEMKKRN